MVLFIFFLRSIFSCQKVDWKLTYTNSDLILNNFPFDHFFSRAIFSCHFCIWKTVRTWTGVRTGQPHCTFLKRWNRKVSTIRSIKLHTHGMNTPVQNTFCSTHFLTSFGTDRVFALQHSSCGVFTMQPIWLYRSLIPLMVDLSTCCSARTWVWIVWIV